MSTTTWPKWSEMTWLRLLEGPGHRVILPIAPTMKRIAYKGEVYNRMPQGRSTLHRGLGCRHYGGSYLWADWWPQMLEKARAEGKIPAEPEVRP
jgi:hypothetical protein